jgi:probable phosphoglycerate mutase
MYRDGELFRTIGQTLGTLTNNQAEYRALLLALRALAVYAARQVEICMDSQLVVMQVQGKYRVRDHGLQALHAEALTLLAKAGNPRFTYVPRERNAIADRMANLALNGEPIDAEISQHAPGTGDANATTA